MKKIEYLLKHNLFFQYLYVFIFSIIFKVVGLFVWPKKKRILFVSLIGKSFSESPRVIYDSIKNDSFFDEYELFWAFENPKTINVDTRLKAIKLNSFRYFVIALSSSFWIANTDIERNLRFKHKKTKYIFTGHGAEYKKVGNAVSNRKIYNLKHVDFACSSSDFDKTIRVRDLKLKEENVNIIGFPTDDILYNLSQQTVAEIKYKHNLNPNKKIILYAPTWRDSVDKNKNSIIDIPIDFDKLKQALHNDYIFLFRGHHLVDKIPDIKYDDFYFDASGFVMESWEALAVSDVLITDYSSILFEFAILEKPIFIFAYDYETYVEERGLYITPFELLPDTTVSTDDELISGILNMDFQKECLNSERVKGTYMQGDGKATEKCVSFIKSFLEKENEAKTHH